MYEELIAKLRDHNACIGIKTLDEAADAIEELSHEIDIDNAAMTAMDAAMPRWISVMGEEPLKVGDDGYNGYLVYVNGSYAVADYATDKYDNVPYFHVDGECEPGVTHYMPLPEPPKGEKE